MKRLHKISKTVLIIALISALSSIYLTNSDHYKIFVIVAMIAAVILDFTDNETV
jgi:hypothetical protein